MQVGQSAGTERYPLLAITGRFQPFHCDHLHLVRHGLGHAERVVIGITNPDARSLSAIPESPHRHLNGANPFSYLERLRMIQAALNAAGVSRERYDVVPFPLDAPGVWASYVPVSATQLVRVYSDWEREKTRRLRAGGYAVWVLEGDPRIRVSGSDIRAAMAAGGCWSQWVPAGAREYLLERRAGVT